MSQLELGRIRFADKSDASVIMTIVNESTRVNFRITNESEIRNLIDNNVISIVQLDNQESIVGFLSLKDSPLQPAVIPSSWEEMVWSIYRAINLNSRNTLFIHMFCWKAGYGRNLVDKILRSVFMHDAYLDYIAVLKSSEKYLYLYPGNAMAEASFRRIQAATKGVCADKVPSLWVADRQEISPRLRIRRAVEEDNDDIVAILEEHSTQLKQMYGEFYISELVAHPGSRVLLVCQKNEKALGVMCLNTQINYEALEEAYVLSPFAGLKHTKEHIDLQPFRQSFDMESATNFKERYTGQSRSKFRVQSNFDVKFDQKVYVTLPNEIPTQTSQSNFSDFLDLLQDEDVEYDIINIQQNLMEVPRQLSSDQSPHIEEFRMFLEKLPQSHDSFEDSTVVSKTSLPSSLKTSSRAVKRYTGKPNAFLLELFAVSPDIDERCGFDILQTAYEMFPDREYCILSLPSNHTPFPLLEHFTMVTPLQTSGKFRNEILYVAHINSIRGKLRVRSGEQHDLHYLYPIVERSGRRQQLLDLFDYSLRSNSQAFSYVLLSENQPVGMVLVGPQDRGELVRTLFNINPESKLIRSDGTIHGAVVSPVFEPHFRWLLREVIRQSKFETLFWPFCLVGKGEFTPKRHLMILTNYMVPLYSRTPLPNITKVAYLDILSEKSAKPLAYSAINRPITSLPKIDINNNIVVVGSSSTGLAFIEALVMDLPMWYLNFTNVTLVSETGLSLVLDCLSAAVTCVPRYGRFTNSYMKRVPFICYIDIITGIMVNINRKDKYITLMNGRVVYYDTLVLTCGLQFQHPAYVQINNMNRTDMPCVHQKLDDPQYKPDNFSLTPDVPGNVMIINDMYKANLSLKKLLAMIEDSKGTASSLSTDKSIIVYGESIEVYSCMAALLELKIKPSHIVFVESYDEEQWPNVNCFNDEKIDDRVQKTIEALGIQVYRHCKMVNWMLRRSYVKSITLMSTYTCFDLNCFALFYYGCKGIDQNTFKALNESGLVYDGGVVVGAHFETNDPNIYAAGTCTRYSRCLHADKYIHKYYYSEDIGEELAATFLNQLDPFMRMNIDLERSQSTLPGYSSSLLAFLGSHMSIPKILNFSKSTKQKWRHILKFDSPVYVFTRLPGPLYYLKLRKPGPDIPMEVALSLPDQGHTLETENDENFFRMQFSVLHIFEGATCLCKSKFQPDFYIKLYGKHERFFNNLFTRYETNLVKDLNDHLMQPWISVFYLICFNSAFENIHTHLNKACNIPDNVRSLLYRCVGKERADECLNLLKCRVPGDSTVVKYCYSHSTLTKLNKPEKKSISSFEVIISCINVGTKAFFFKTCGQSSDVRAAMATLWEALGGDRVIWHYLSEYLHRYAVTNPQYMKPKPENTFMCHL